MDPDDNDADTWPRSRRLRCLQLWAIATSLLLVKAFAHGLLRGDPRASVTVTPQRIDLNRGRLGELAALPGIGPVRAAAIVLYRVRHGPFTAVADLDRVDGIGPDTVRQLLPFAVVGPPP